MSGVDGYDPNERITSADLCMPDVQLKYLTRSDVWNYLSASGTGWKGHWHSIGLIERAPLQELAAIAFLGKHTKPLSFEQHLDAVRQNPRILWEGWNRDDLRSGLTKLGLAEWGNAQAPSSDVAGRTAVPPVAPAASDASIAPPPSA